MICTVVALSCYLAGSRFAAIDSQPPHYPSFDYDTVRTHEIPPHRRTIPLDGVREGFNQLRLTLTVSAAGEVINAEAGGDPNELKY